MPSYRRIVWYFKGLREYTKDGYLAACKEFNETDLDVNCNEKHFLVTGANSGIGKSVSHEIIKHGGILHMVCRNKENAQKVKEEFLKENENACIFLHILDLSESRQVAEFAEKFVADHETLDVLVNNAGCLLNERKVNASNIEINFATNTLGTHLLTTGLIPILQRTANSRVIIVTSGGMLTQKLDKDDMQMEKLIPYNGAAVYSQNKRQQVVMTKQYAKKYPSIHFSTMHPGWADTPAVQNSLPEFYNKMKDKLRTPEEGADTAVWLTLSTAALKYPSGLFFQDRKPVSTHLPLARTRVSEEEEMEFMEKLDELSKNFR